MRINYSDDEQYAGQFDLYQANCDRSLAGRKGQAALRELEAALLALPKKRLIANELDNADGDVCAIGALVRHKGITPKSHPEFEMEEVGVECGMPRLVAWKVVELNDVLLDYKIEKPDFKRLDYTPEERYELVLAWVREHLRPPVGREEEGVCL